MRKTIRKNFRFDVSDIANLDYIRAFLGYGISEADAVRYAIKEMRCILELVTADIAEELGLDSEAINPSPALSERSAESDVERFLEFTDEDPILPF